MDRALLQYACINNLLKLLYSNNVFPAQCYNFLCLSLFSLRGAVAADSRIDTGDMLLEVNGVNFEHMTNDDAVRALREIVQQPG